MSYIPLQNHIQKGMDIKDMITDRSDLPLTKVELHLPGWHELNPKDELMLTEFLELTYLKAVSPPDPVEMLHERFLRRWARKELRRYARRVVSMVQDVF